MEKYRFKEVCNNSLWNSNSPVEVVSYSILEDKDNGKNILQLNNKNISDNVITSVVYDINCYDTESNFILKLNDVSYLGLASERGDNFGSRQPIKTDSDNISYIEVIVKKVTFNDGSQIDDTITLNKIQEQQFAEDYFCGLYGQYQKEAKSYGIDDSKVYTVRDDYWLCACGQPNTLTSSSCCSCNASRGVLEKISDTAYIAKRKKINDEYVEQNNSVVNTTSDNENNYDYFGKSKNTNFQKLAIAACCAGVIVVIGILGIHRYSLSNDYEKAEELLNSGKYEEAINSFKELKKYSDSAERVKEAQYRIAQDSLDAGKYDDAIQKFSEISGYSDAADKAKDAKYQKGVNFYNTGNNESALAVFTELTGYKEADSYIQKINNTAAEAKAKAEADAKAKAEAAAAQQEAQAAKQEAAAAKQRAAAAQAEAAEAKKAAAQAYNSSSYGGGTAVVANTSTGRVYLRTGPGASTYDGFVYEGEMVYVLDYSGGYTYCQTTDGRYGWITSSKLA